MNENSHNPYESPALEVIDTSGITWDEVVSYFVLTIFQGGTAAALHYFLLRNQWSKTIQFLPGMWDWVASGLGYCVLFLILNLCMIRMRWYRAGDTHAIDNYLRLGALILVLLIAGVFGFMGFLLSLVNSSASSFVFSLSGLIMLSSPWRWDIRSKHQRDQ